MSKLEGGINSLRNKIEETIADKKRLASYLESINKKNEAEMIKRMFRIK